MAAIDPDKLMEMSADTIGACDTIAEIGGNAQTVIDDVSDLVGGGPSAKSRAESIAGDLIEEAGRAQGKAIDYVTNQKPIDDLSQLAMFEYWLPNLENLGDPFSNETGAFTIGLPAGLMERYGRGYYVAAPNTPVPLTSNVRSGLPSAGTVNGTSVVQRPSGLLIPKNVADDMALRNVATPPAGYGDDARRAGRFRNTPIRPPGWAKWGARGLTVVGTGLTAYDNYTGQWEQDQRYHPDMATDDRVSRATGAATVTAGGAAAGAWVGAKGGAAIGGAFGSLFGPGPGTAIGAAVGGVIGGVAGAWAGSQAGSAVREYGAKAGQAIKDVGKGIGDAVASGWNSLFG
ncbi:hypothetical protein EF847_06265 [Actinobacteria bacterium YIM 96077]|uniref:Glycine zipper domain-containing protein n=1 Tax=Phytoactinopolyspora halophila TaxID=1981511 RepID=A0A329Q9Y0_9ACTN|nr:hypothetical protein [Phytoactinopolyspora halophila]AYY12369.1 hypothetical protein EF847_06265 [Actinobacteria bacterium YIM 96077]RAW09220.1 hypothetical protein DPM12_22270 [Phytoactinopolyspora halophila]